MPRRLTALLALSALYSIPVLGSDWPHLRGPGYDGRALAPASLGDGPPGLELEWRTPLGSGYSGIAAAAGRVVTMFSSGDSDWVAAFDLRDGDELWRYRLDTVNRGRDGSADGPISSPVIADGRVFALGPKGQLMALGLEDGQVAWSRDMGGDFGSPEPDFGYGVTPLLVDGKLLILTGVAGSAVTALEPMTGEIVWSAGSGEYRYQIPVAMSAGGKTHVVIGAGRRLLGIDPSDGTELWKHELGEEEGIDAALTAAGEGRFLVSIHGQATMFAIEQGKEGFALKELYRTRELGGTYALPVYHDGHLYGFRGQILACVDAENGERVWRSRPPGGRGLILLGDRLAIFGAGGHVVLADATPTGYAERARVQALSASGYTWPSYADGRILVRNLEEMAAVALGGVSSPRPGEAGTVSGEFGRFLERLESAPDKPAVIAEFLDARESLPIVEGDRVHFVFVGEAEDMAIVGTMTPAGGAEAMYRVAGTDLFHRSFAVEPGGRWEYQFVRDFSERLTDPRNPRTAPQRMGKGEVSEFSLPGYRPAAHLAESVDRPRGTLEEISFKSEKVGLDRQVKVYLPPGYADSDESYPLLVVHDGSDWLEKGLMNRSLDSLVGSRSQPLVVAFLTAREEWWLEAGGTGTGEHVEMLVSELVPLLEERYRLQPGPAMRAVMGNTGFGLTSAYAALKHPEVFGKVAIQSPQLGLGFEDALMELIERRPRPDIDFYLDWSRYELRNLDSGIDLGVDSQRLAEALRAGGYDFVGGEVLDSAGWGGWRSRTDRILEALFPLE